MDPTTVLHGLVEVAEHLRAFARSCLCAVHGRQVQRDAWYAVLRAVKGGHRSEAEAWSAHHTGCGPPWTPRASSCWAFVNRYAFGRAV